MPTPATNPWAALLPAALTGTRRQPFAPLPGLTPPLGAEAAATEKQLLLTTANLALVQRAGRRFTGPAGSLPTGPWPAEPWPAIPDDLARQLEQLLAECPSQTEDHHFPMGPQVELLLAVLASLRQLRHRLPRRTALLMLRYNWDRRIDTTTARRVLGEQSHRLHQLLGPALSPWFDRTLGRVDGATATPEQLFYSLRYHTQEPMPADHPYLADFERLPAEQRTQLLWQAWQLSGGDSLPPTLQAELDELLAATPPAERPWTTTYESLQRVGGHPRLAGHPVLAEMGRWAAPLLTLERPAGKPPRVRIELPVGGEKKWEKVGLRRGYTHGLYCPDKEEEWLQEQLYALGPRYWADHWQLPPVEVVALVGASKHGRVVLEGWLKALGGVRGVFWPEPEFAQALLATLPRARLIYRMFLAPHLPLAGQLTWLATILPTEPAKPAWANWVEAVQQGGMLPLHEPAIGRLLLPALAAALAGPGANAEQSRELPNLLHLLASQADPHLLPEVQAALGAVVPAQPAHAEARDLLLRGLTLRLDLLRACGAAELPPTTPTA